MEWQCCSRFWIQLIVLSLSLGMLLWFIFHILDEEIQETKSSSKKSDQQKDSDIEILIFLRYLVGFSVCLLILAVLAKVYTRYFIRNQASSQETFMGQFMRRELRRLPRRISSFHMDLMMRDFTSADYELLQRLDDDIESNKKRKAAEHEISRLPHFTLTPKDVSCLSNENKTCAICLEPFEVKEVVKIVPCLHRYHLKCIDTWLREHAICPICKFPVTDL
jgi:hypothetical protein